MKKVTILGIFILVLDQIIKQIIAITIPLDRSVSVIGDFFKLTYVRNYGAAWSVLSGNRFFLIIVALASLFFLYYFLHNRILNRSESIIYGCLLGGILGNLYDRIVYGYVIDYLEFTFFDYHYPIFNFADICIVISVFCLIILIWKGDVNHGTNGRSK